MDESKKRLVMIITIVVCLVLAAVISAKNFLGGGGGAAASSEMTLKCDSCGAGYDIKAEEYQQLITSSGVQQNMLMMGGAIPVKCIKCGQQSAYQAMRCPKCKEAFVPGDAGDQNYVDKCPKCNYSGMKEQNG